METEKKMISLEENRMTLLSQGELLKKLRELYPRAFGLRNTIVNSTIIFSDQKEGIIYEIQQDNEDHYPKYHYVLYCNGEFDEISYQSKKATIIDGQGLFFLSERSVFHTPIFCEEKDLGSHTRIGYISENFKWQFATLDRLILSHCGLYIEAKAEDGSQRVAFIENMSPGVFPSEKSITPLLFPKWMNSWQPGHNREITFFSDEGVIYTIDHKTTKISKFSYARYTDIRLGDNYNWRPLFEKDPLMKSSYPFVYTPKNRSNSLSGYFFNKGRLPREINAQSEHTWCFFGEGSIISFFHNGHNELRIIFHFSTNETEYWPQRDIFCKNINPDTKVKLVRKSANVCYIAINDQWYRITMKMIHDVL